MINSVSTVLCLVLLHRFKGSSTLDSECVKPFVENHVTEIRKLHIEAVTDWAERI